MAFLPMVDRTSFSRSSTYASNDYIRLTFNKTKKESQSDRITLSIGGSIVKNLGWFPKDKIVIKWDEETREGIIRRAGPDESHNAINLSKMGKTEMLQTSFMWVHGHPKPNKSVLLEGIEIKDHEIFFDFPQSCFTYLIKERAELLKQNNEI